MFNFSLAVELLKKETLDLVDIIGCLGDRPFPLPDSIKDYLNEIQKRKDKKVETVSVSTENVIEEKVKDEEENEEKEEKENKDSKVEKKDDKK